MAMTCLVSIAFARNVPDGAIVKIRDASRQLMQGMEKEALGSVDECLALLQNGDFTDDKNFSDILYNAAKIRQSCGDAKGGLEVAKRALESAMARQGEKNHAVGLAHVAMALCYASLEDEVNAQKSAEAGWEVLGKVPYQNPAVPNLIPRCHAMANLGSTYLAKGDFLMAEKYYRFSAADAQRLMSFPLQGASYDLGKYEAAGRALNLIGAFYVQVGDYRRAIPLCLNSLQVKRAGAASSMPGNTQGAEETYITLSRAFRGIGDLKSARQYSMEAMRMAGGSAVARRQVVARSTLSSVLHDEGDFEGSLTMAREILEMEKSIREDPEFMDASMANNLGWGNLLVGNLPEARKLLTRAYSLARETKIEETEIGGNILFSLSLVEFLDGNPERGVMGLKKAAGVYEKVLNQLIGFGSNSQKLAFLQRLRNKTDFVIGIHFGKDPGNEELAKEALMTVFRRKGRMTDLARQSAELVQAGRRPSEALEELGRTRSALSLLNLSLGIFSRDAAAEFDHDWTMKLEEAERELNNETRKSGRTQSQEEFSTDLVSKKLQSDEILVEYVIYRPFDLKVPKARYSELPLRCAAFVLAADGSVTSLDLGDYRSIQQLAVEFRRSLANSGDPRYEVSGQQLHARLAAPVLKAFPEAKRWRVAPDGQLHLIPFGALLDEKKSYLDDRVGITYLTTGKELLEVAKKPATSGQVTIFAGPEYTQEKVRTAAATVAAGYSPRLADFWQQLSTVGAPLYFSPLPGTLKEAERIKAVFPDARVVTGSEATEANFKAGSKSGVIHVASHGFYLDEDLMASTEQRGLKRVKPAPVAGLTNANEDFLLNDLTALRGLDNPLLNCGLVFAGANKLYDGRDDGVVTGLEVLNLDLSGTELVVLSACETGVGEVVTGEGVLGLTQAFRVAGASSLVTSLWKVSDEATIELMAEFYDQLSKGAPKGEALGNAAAKLRKGDKWGHPAYWAAFVLSGENGALAK
jgi:CHAT domain-containing protein